MMHSCKLSGKKKKKTFRVGPVCSDLMGREWWPFGERRSGTVDVVEEAGKGCRVISLLPDNTFLAALGIPLDISRWTDYVPFVTIPCFLQQHAYVKLIFWYHIFDLKMYKCGCPILPYGRVTSDIM